MVVLSFTFILLSGCDTTDNYRASIPIEKPKQAQSQKVDIETLYIVVIQ